MFRDYNKFLSVKFFTAPQFLKNLNKRGTFKNLCDFNFYKLHNPKIIHRFIKSSIFMFELFKP